MALNCIEHQHVSRRRKPTPFDKLRAAPFYNVTYPSAVFGCDFMREIKQKPAPSHRHKHAVSHGKRPFFLFLQKVSRRGKTEIIHRGEKSRGPKTSGFSFSLPSLMTMAVVAGTLVISLIALNWEGFSLPETTNIVNPGPDGEGRRILEAYAESPLSNLWENTGASSGTKPPSGSAGAPVEIPAPPSGTASPESANSAVITPLPLAPSPPEDGAPAPEQAAAETPQDVPLNLMETFEWSSYTVQKGDSVSKIAARFGISMDAVIASNNIKNARRLREGEILRIPNIDGIPHTVTKGDSLLKIAKTYKVPLEVILDTNGISSEVIREGETFFIPGASMAPEALRLALGELFIYPAGKRITSNYGWRISPITGERHFHAALDLAGKTGATVKAAMEGTAAVVGLDRILGKYVILSHANNYQTLYAHLSAASVKQGDRVIQGAKIGEVGNTGQSTGPHLHFAVFKNGKPVNPLDYLN